MIVMSLNQMIMLFLLNEYLEKKKEPVEPPPVERQQAYEQPPQQPNHLQAWWNTVISLWR